MNQSQAMAQSLFDILTNVPFDNQAVQSLLDCSNLVAEYEQTVIDQEESDVFQCGKCKNQFTSLQIFLLHKKDHLTKPPEETVNIPPFIVDGNNEAINTGDICSEDIRDDSVYNSPQTYEIQTDQLEGPIILGDNDMLFNIGQEDSTCLSSNSSFTVPIIMNSESLQNFDANDLSPDNKPLIDNADETCIMESEKIKIAVNTDLTMQEKTEEVIKSDTKNDQTQNLKYKCSYCQKQFAKKFYWQQHERSHTGEKPYQCVVCGRPFAQKSNVKKHMSSHKVWPGTAIHSLPPEAPTDGSIDKTYHCQFCKEIFDSYKALKGHLIMSHLTLKVYKCVQNGCSKMFAELEEFLEHTRSHKRSEYRCHVCGEAFNTLSDLGMHQYSHSVQKHKTTEKYYCCSVCKSSFSNLKALQHHIDTTTHDYTCPHCGKSFLIERFLRRHLKTHASSAKFTCENCGKAFKTEQYLANHKLIHSEETPFHCTQCPARFKRKDRLGRHMLIHDLSKRLKCPYRNFLGCMSEFSRADKLKRHLLTHSNVKKFSCSHCNRNYHRVQAIKHHDVLKHSVKCEICLHSLKTKEQISTHNCDQTVGFKKHGSQLPRKATGSFKPRKPTPKRQMIPKASVLGISEKEKSDKLKIEDTKKQVIEQQRSMIHKMGSFTATLLSKPGNILISTTEINDGFEAFKVENKFESTHA